MKVMVFFLFYFSLFFLMIGILSMFESKVLGYSQNSISTYSVVFFNMYHFFLDFLKVLCKGSLGGFFKGCLILFLFYFFMLMINMFFMPINCFSNKMYYGVIFYLFLEMSLMSFKIILVNFFNHKFSKFGNYKMKSVYLFGEMIFLFFIFSFMITYSFFNFTNTCYFYYFKINKVFFVLIVLFSFFFFLVILLKFLKVFFDYLEMESEYVGGLILEMYGMFFSLWMMVEYVLLLSLILFYVFYIFVFFCNYFIFYYTLIFLNIFCFFFFWGMFMSMSYFSMFLFILKMYFAFFIFLYMMINILFIDLFL